MLSVLHSFTKFLDKEMQWSYEIFKSQFFIKSKCNHNWSIKMPKLGAGSSKNQQHQTDLLSTTKICGQNIMKWTILTGTAVDFMNRYCYMQK